MTEKIAHLIKKLLLQANIVLLHFSICVYCSSYPYCILITPLRKGVQLLSAIVSPTSSPVPILLSFHGQPLCILRYFFTSSPFNSLSSIQMTQEKIPLAHNYRKENRKINSLFSSRFMTNQIGNSRISSHRSTLSIG